METKIGQLNYSTEEEYYHFHMIVNGKDEFLSVQFQGDQEVPLNKTIALSLIKRGDLYIVPDVTPCYSPVNET